MKLSHLFLPHAYTHKRAHLLSWEALVIYILLFVFLQVSFSILEYAKPGVLGINSVVSQQEVIELTNQERVKRSLSPLTENPALNEAAKLKAANMFSENYWAHFSPGGRTPWDFILGSGYKFTFAGENLAKNFYNSQEVVGAWMASPTHKDNLLNGRYRDIGIAVVEGVLNGQKTTLVVQMFGTTEKNDLAPLVLAGGKQLLVPKEDFESPTQLIASTKMSIPSKSLLDPYQLYRFVGLGLVLMIGVLVMVDLAVLKRRGVFHFRPHYVAHLGILSLTAVSLINMHVGDIL